MTDTNLQTEGDCPQCLQYEKTGQQLCDLVAKLEKEIEELREANKAIKQTNIEAYEKVRQVLDENKELREALTRLVHNAGIIKLAAQNTGSLLADSYEAARKLLDK